MALHNSLGLAAIEADEDINHPAIPESNFVADAIELSIEGHGRETRRTLRRRVALNPVWRTSGLVALARRLVPAETNDCTGHLRLWRHHKENPGDFWHMRSEVSNDPNAAGARAELELRGNAGSIGNRLELWLGSFVAIERCFVRPSSVCQTGGEWDVLQNSSCSKALQAGGCQQGPSFVGSLVRP